MRRNDIANVVMCLFYKRQQNGELISFFTESCHGANVECSIPLEEQNQVDCFRDEYAGCF